MLQADNSDELKNAALNNKLDLFSLLKEELKAGAHQLWLGIKIAVEILGCDKSSRGVEYTNQR